MVRKANTEIYSFTYQLQIPIFVCVPLSDFSIRLRTTKSSISSLRTTVRFQYSFAYQLQNPIFVCVPLSDFSIEFAYHYQISVFELRTSFRISIRLRTTIRFQYRVCVPLCDFSIRLRTVLFQILISRLRTSFRFLYRFCVPLLNFSIPFTYMLRDFSIDFSVGNGKFCQRHQPHNFSVHPKITPPPQKKIRLRRAFFQDTLK